MFDIGFIELALVTLVGLLVLGPETLPSALQNGFRWYLQLARKFQQGKDEFNEQLRNHEITQTFEQEKAQLVALDEAVRSTHLDLLESLGTNRKP